MADFERQKRPALAVRRASGPSARLDRNAAGNLGTAMPLSERLNRADSPSESTTTSATSSTFRSPSLTAVQGLSKLTRSASSTAPASSESSRPQSLRSISGSVETTAFAEMTNTTSSPLITPGDDLVNDPLLAATKRSLTASPSIFNVDQNVTTPNASTTATLSVTTVTAAAKRDTLSSTEQKMGVKSHRDYTTGAASLTPARNAATKGLWKNSTPPMNWLSTSSLPTSSQSTLIPSEVRAGQQGSEQPQIEDSKSQDLVSLTQRLAMNDEKSEDAPSRASTLRPGETEEQQVTMQQPPLEQVYYQAHQLPPSHQQQFTSSHHPTFHQQPHYYTPMDSRSPELYSSSFQQSPVSALGSMDPTSFETFRSTPDPYAPIYGLPAPSIASSSTPQSPNFGHHSHQASESNMFIYPNTYPHGLNNMASLPGITQQGMMGPRSGPGSAMVSNRPPLHSSPSHNSNMMQHYPPQSPMLMSPSTMDRSGRRESISFQGPITIQGGPYNLANQWTPPPPVPSGGFMHAHSPSWPGGFEVRPNNQGRHQRVLSGHQLYPSNAMTFMPGSMSPPSSFFRPPGSSRMGMHSRSPSDFSQFSQQRSAHSDVHRSPLLEDFRNKHNKGRRFELNDIRGFIVEFSSDQHGSRFTQEKLDTANEEETSMVFDELLPSALSLMTDVFGNYVIQKLFEHGTQEMRVQLIDKMQGHILSLSLGTYGCRVVQKALEYVEAKDQMRMADELRRDVLTCVRDQNANHVIQKILEHISPSTEIDFIPQTFRNNVYSLAAHCYSCRVLQRIFEHCEESQRRPLIDELLRDTEKLTHDQYGNYVIQWILQNASKPDKDVVINLAKGNVLRLSKHKFASNVVEQVIRAASHEERYSLIEEIMIPIQDESSVEAPVVGAVTMMKDQYGNYVLQRFLELSEGQQRVRLISYIKPALHSLKRFSSGYAKHLAAIERLLETSPTRSYASTMASKSTMTGDVSSPASTA